MLPTCVTLVLMCFFQSHWKVSFVTEHFTLRANKQDGNEVEKGGPSVEWRVLAGIVGVPIAFDEYTIRFAMVCVQALFEHWNSSVVKGVFRLMSVKMS